MAAPEKLHDGGPVAEVAEVAAPEKLHDGGPALASMEQQVPSPGPNVRGCPKLLAPESDVRRAHVLRRAHVRRAKLGLAQQAGKLPLACDRQAVG